MSMKMKTAMAAVVLAAAFCGPTAAMARGHGFVALGVGFPIVSSPSYYVPGHYETRMEQVVVAPGHFEDRTEKVVLAPAHYEDRLIPAVEKTVYDKYGWPQTVLVQPARAERVLVPEKAQMRTTRVWVPPVTTTRAVEVYVPGYWTGSAPAAGVVAVGGGVRF